MAEGYTRKQISEFLNMPERTINYYTQTKVVIPEIDKGKGRGTVRRYSKKNIVELAILKQLSGYGLSFQTVEKVFRLLLKFPFPVQDKGITMIDRRGIIAHWEKMKPDSFIVLYQTDGGGFKLEMSLGLSVNMVLNEDRMQDSGSALIINIGRIVTLIKDL